uniref:Cystatin domain-containing protein n=1 Tax=Strongyloides venezuelensis TaxID=75913 RepID=A0A0K0FZH8_STRVS
MKYLITFIVIAIITFVTINAKKKPNTPKRTTPTTPSLPPWKPWNGTKPFSAKEIVKNATELYYNETGLLFKLLEITLNQTRIINGTNRYRVQYVAADVLSRIRRNLKKVEKNKKILLKKKNLNVSER